MDNTTWTGHWNVTWCLQRLKKTWRQHHFCATSTPPCELQYTLIVVRTQLGQFNWQKNEDYPRPVAFISHKISGAQYRYDARNVEALAAQIALTTWRTLLLGVKFEFFSDHDSLQYLFTQKSPSQRILCLCEFLADYNFEEVKYVPGPQNVVPDFLSRPWEATGNEPASLLILVKRWPKR